MVFWLMSRTGYHLVDMSPWPVMASISGFTITSGLIGLVHSFNPGIFLLFVGFASLIGTVILWWADVITEGTILGQHTSLVARGLRVGMMLFILSEVAFFFSLFWAFFHCSLGALCQHELWPHAGILPITYYSIPLLNTGLLLASGVSVTWAHKAVKCWNVTEAKQALFITIFLGMYFTKLQWDEYNVCSFCISDGSFGSTFFVMTGFHGLHVIIGTIFLIVCLGRTHLYHFHKGENHVGLEMAIWYWHFVDVVWLFVYSFVYCWGMW
uniref:Cytochrome c oxidase subunit 3 n=1 Tax=Sinonovacula constricta TaxID=98310 RepID=B5AYE9_SINCO|nr:cytochrome c oxidase subunit III [Sinonovacula constricta]ACF41616.1 cytochrome c oxidase subunit III [Sinonovacula constricta]AEV94321.1 cytochrome c oxidase subunit III [Sinonovacula constricta]